MTTRPCPACLAQGGWHVGDVEGFAIQRCRRCGTVYTDRLPGDEDAADYAGFYEDGRDVEIPAFVLERLREVVRSLERYRSTGAWLDIGCGSGTLLRAAGQESWAPIGTEVAPAAVKAMRAEGLDARLGFVEQLDLPAGGFDVVSMTEVIEHVPDPDALLHEAVRLLRPGGALYLTTPHGRGISGRLLSARWSIVAPPDHLQLFSTSGMRAALGRAGLRTVAVRTHGANPHELLAALRPAQRDAAAAGRVQSSYQLNEALSTSRRGKLVKTILNGLLDITRLGDALKAVAERAEAGTD
jgi:2-polyprenyl-3-methyl-5-hydroxy-6-metoxy-1,4-benzoquinol methylase